MCHLEAPLTGPDSVGLGVFRVGSSQLSGDANAELSSRVGKVAICCPLHGEIFVFVI